METKHVEGVSRLFRTVCEENPRIVTEKFKREIYDMARRVVELEDAFIDLAYANHTIEGLNKDEVKQYIRYIADRRLIMLGLKGNFGVKENPLPWLDWIVSATNHTNFFEGKVAEYEVGGLQGSIDYQDMKTFTVFSKDGCPYCIKVKELIINLGHEFNEIKLNDDLERNKFYDRFMWKGKDRSVPKIFLDGELIAKGYTDFKTHFES